MDGDRERVCRRCQQRPGRWNGKQWIHCKPCLAAAGRGRYARNIEHQREIKRRFMAKARYDPEKREQYLEYGRRAYANGGAERQRQRRERLTTERPFKRRAQSLTSHGTPVTEAQLRDLWDSQGGRCALTGWQLEVSNAEVDHVTALSVGGTRELGNLRWLHRDANRARRALSDDEFLALCRAVVRTSEGPQ